MLSQPLIRIELAKDVSIGEASGTFNGDADPITIHFDGKQWSSYDVKISLGLDGKPISTLCILFFENNTVDG